MKHRIAAIVALLCAALLPAQDAPKTPRVSSASELRKLGAAHFETDEDSKTLIVTTDEETNETIKRIVAELDRPIPQALINVVFLEVTYGDDLDVGADIEYVAVRADGSTHTASSLFGVTEGITDGGAFGLLRGDLNATLKALATKTKTEVLSRPSIMARNNEESTITIGSEQPYVTNSVTSDSGGVTNTVQYEDIGIILTVTPHISGDGMVELEVEPEISTVLPETVKISDTVQASTFGKRSAKTRVIVPDGQTVVIGGLMDDKEEETVRKVPLLGDIPLLGGLFRRKTVEKSQTELLIFLTPHVVTGKTAAALRAQPDRITPVPGRIDAGKLRKYVPAEGDGAAEHQAGADPGK